MPLHTSVHHDGWQGANPRGYTIDPSIHGRFETAFVDRMNLGEAGLVGLIPAAKRLQDPFTAVLAHLERSHTRVEHVYQLDRDGAYADARNSDARALVLTCTSEAAAPLRDLIYTAWLTSGEPLTTRPGDLQPMNPRHPQYNPATAAVSLHLRNDVQPEL